MLHKTNSEWKKNEKVSRETFCWRIHAKWIWNECDFARCGNKCERIWYENCLTCEFSSAHQPGAPNIHNQFTFSNNKYVVTSGIWCSAIYLHWRTAVCRCSACDVRWENDRLPMPICVFAPLLFSICSFFWEFGCKRINELLIVTFGT